ncbi:protein MFI isoform X2 [Betta splendens]|uniref:Protein MFI isoform X2 n=1 Tax=Betta splendens TaxID=158456 RepID=A0A6P7MBS0_BETSP|nr:protein MFI isoform X2 [Betta splendens]
MSSQDQVVQEEQLALQAAAARTIQRAWCSYVTSFPPSIYYKIFTQRPIADVCAGSPRDYTQPGLRRPVARQTNNGWPLAQEAGSGRYQRVENNSWRLFWVKAAPAGEDAEICKNQKMDFHYSKMQRQQDVFRWKKRRRIEWLKQMYSRGRPQAQSLRRHVVSPVEDADREVQEEEEEDADVLQLLSWSSTLDFDRYIEEWRRLACSHSSEPGSGTLL